MGYYFLIGLICALVLFAIHFARYLDGKPVPEFGLMNHIDFIFSSFLIGMFTALLWVVTLPLGAIVDSIYWWKRGRK